MDNNIEIINTLALKIANLEVQLAVLLAENRVLKEQKDDEEKEKDEK